MPMFNDGMTVADLKEVLDSPDIKDEDKIYINGEYGKTSIYSIRRSVAVEMPDQEESGISQEDPYVILNG